MRKKILVGGLALAMMLMVLSGCSAKTASRSYEQTIATARTEIWNAISGGGASSATVAIVDNGRVIYHEGFAMADRTARQPVTADTQFNICSVSKVFTAAAVLQLCQDGKLALDQPVVDYLPEFTMKDSRYRDITVRMLLNHSSGLPGTFTNNAETTAPDADYTADFLAYLAGTELKAEPGQISVYCNDGFTLAEILVEKVSGQSFSDYLAANIFNKAGMNQSSCYFKAGNSNLARKYNADGSAAPVEYINSLGSGGIASTAIDLCKYGQALLDGKIMTQAMFAEYTSPQYGAETLPSGTPLYPYGLGWDSVSLPDFERQGIKVLGKNGGSPQYNSQLYILPDQKITVAIVFAGSAEVTGIANDIVQSLIDENGLGQVEESAQAEPTAATIPDAILSAAGIYGDGSAIMKIDFTAEKNAMIYQKYQDGAFVSQGTFPYLSDGYFHMPAGYRIGFSENAGSELFVVYDSLTEAGVVSGQKLAPGDTTLDASRFAGKAWLPINLSAVDASPIAGKTGVLAELPGYIVYSVIGGAETLYGLKDATTTQMVLPYGRDLAAPAITSSDGKDRLTMMDYQLVNTTDVVSLTKDEALNISSDGLNLARKIDQDGTISAVIPDGGRIIIYGPDLSPAYDSQNGPIDGSAVAAGSYLLLIGKPGDRFSIDYPS